MKTLLALLLSSVAVLGQTITNEAYECLYQIPADQLAQLNYETWLASTNSQGLRFGGFAIDGWTNIDGVVTANVRITTSKAQQRVLLGLDPYPDAQQASLASKQAVLSKGIGVKVGDIGTQPVDPINTPPAIVPINDDPASVFPTWYVKDLSFNKQTELEIINQ